MRTVTTPVRWLDLETDFRVVVLGGGVLASHLKQVSAFSFVRLAELTFEVVPRRECDVTVWADLVRVMAKYRPHVVVNCAAFTNVNRAEQEKTRAFQVNALGATRAALAARTVGAHFVQISTDYVFPGHSGPYRTTDEPFPINAYGLSKRLGEVGVLAVNPEASVIRLGWLFGADYPSCAPMLAESENYELKVGNVRAKHRASIWDDIYGHPTHVRNAAELIFSYLVRDVYAGVAKGPIIHLGSSEPPISWFEFLSEYYDVKPVSASSAQARRPVRGGLMPTPFFEMWKRQVSLAFFRAEMKAAREERISTG